MPEMVILSSCHLVILSSCHLVTPSPLATARKICYTKAGSKTCRNVMIRLGVAGRIMGRAGLRARDGRRAEQAPHLSVSLLLVREVLLYLAEQRISCYRLAEDLAPYLTDQRHPEFARQL